VQLPEVVFVVVEDVRTVEDHLAVAFDNVRREWFLLFVLGCALCVVGAAMCSASVRTS
jgi:hypothetical protein